VWGGGGGGGGGRGIPATCILGKCQNRSEMMFSNGLMSGASCLLLASLEVDFVPIEVDAPCLYLNQA